MCVYIYIYSHICLPPNTWILDYDKECSNSWSLGAAETRNSSRGAIRSFFNLRLIYGVFWSFCIRVYISPTKYSEILLKTKNRNSNKRTYPNKILSNKIFLIFKKLFTKNVTSHEYMQIWKLSQRNKIFQSASRQTMGQKSPNTFSFEKKRKKNSFWKGHPLLPAFHGYDNGDDSSSHFTFRRVQEMCHCMLFMPTSAFRSMLWYARKSTVFKI